MSIKRRIQYRFDRLVNFAKTFALPRWLTSPAFRLTCAIIAIIFGVGYLAKTASSAASGYQIHTLEKEVSLLEQDTKKMEVELAEFSSMASVRSRLAEVNMAPVMEIKFFTPAGVAVAKK